MHTNNSASLFILASLFSILFLVIFNFSISMMGSLYIVSELGGSHYITSYTIIFYSLGNALGVPLGVSISVRYGPVRSLVGCLALFAFFSWMCAEAANYPLFIIFRFFQGFVSGPFYVLVNQLFSNLTPQNKKGTVTATILTMFAVTPVLGACFGGWVAYAFHWRWMFYFNVPLIIFLACFIYFYLHDVVIQQDKKKFDAVGYLFYFAGLFCLCFVATTGQEFDWWRSPLLVTLALIGIPTFIFFIFWEISCPYPIVNIKLLKNFAYSFAIVNLAILFAGYFGMVLLLGLWLSLYANYTPIWITVLISGMAFAGLLPPVLVGKRLGEKDTRLPLLFAIIFFALSCFYSSQFDVEVNFGKIAIPRIIAGFGIALFLPSIFRLAFRTYPDEKAIDALVVFQAIRGTFCGLGAAFYIILWQRRRAFYYQRLGASLTSFSQETEAFFKRAKIFFLDGLSADAKLNQLLDRQATALALDDCFFFMGWTMLFLLSILVFTFFFSSNAFFPEKNRKNIERSKHLYGL